MRLVTLLLLFLSLLIYSCASRSTPSGGPKDEDPPVLLSITPPNGTLNFEGNEVYMEFNERVDVSNLQTELIITPFLEMEIEHVVKKNSVRIQFQDTFPSNTTISLNFRNSIVDVTEKNPAENLTLAFSTGNYIDSLELQAEITDLFTSEPQEQYTVGLYNAMDTIDLFNGPPLYLLNTSKAGIVDFTYVKNGDYKLFTFLDKNKNGTCESSKEPFGFYPGIIELDSNIRQLKIRTQHLNLDTLELNSARQSGQYFLIKYNKNIAEFEVEPIDQEQPVIVFDTDPKALKVYNTVTISDSLLLSITTSDSVGFKTTDSIYVKFEETRRPKDQFEIRPVEAGYFHNKSLFKTRVTANKPIKRYLLDSIRIQLDSTTYMYSDTTWDVTITNNDYDLQITFPTDTTLNHYIAKAANQRSLPPTLIFSPESIFSIEDDTSKLQSIKIKKLTLDMFGVLSGFITPDSLSAILQLLDKDYNVIQQIDTTRFQLNYLNPATYIIRAFIDLNKNNKWDPGNIYELESPEPIWYYTDPDSKAREIPLKANWEVTDLEITGILPEDSLNNNVDKIE